MAVQSKDKVGDLQKDGKQAAKQAERQAKKAAYSPWAVTLTRLGYIARGLLYLTVGVMAFLVAFGGLSQVPDYPGAIATLGKTQFGFILLVLIFIGMIGYALWGLIRGILDPLHKGDDLKGWIARAGYIVSAISYGLLAIPTWQILNQNRSVATSGTQTAQSQHLAATLLTQPFGKWLILAIGIGAVGVGIYQIYYAMQKEFERQFQPFELDKEQKKWANRIGRFGYAARGVAFSLIGIFFVQAAQTVNPSKVQGIDGAFQFLAHQPYGAYLVGIVALGFVAFGVYSMMNAWWFRRPRRG